jgi:hypothetical protein
MPNDEPTPEAESAVAVYPSPPAPYPWLRPRPTVTIKKDLLPAVSLVLLLASAGMAIGWLWSRLAPPQRFVVLDDRSVPLPVESYHRFDDLAVFAVLGLAAGVVTGVGVWLMRQRRGPVMMLAAVLGGTAGAIIAQWLGTTWADARYLLPATTKIGDIVTKAPVIESGLAIITWPLATALTYGVFAAWNGMDDLGRRLS